MANTIRLKRRTLASGTGVPGSLAQGEVAYSEHDQKLHIGIESAGIHVIAGSGQHVTWPGVGIITQTAAASGATPPTVAARTMTGTANVLTVTNGDGISGNPTFDIADNPQLSGTGGMLLPQGTTLQQVDTEATFRYNTDDNIIEWYNGATWDQPDVGGGAPDQNLFLNVAGDSGTNAVADTTTDTLSILGTATEITTVGSSGADSITIALANNTALPGAPTAATAAVDTNTTQIATTAFVVAQIADDAPAQNLFLTMTGDTGTATADSTTDNLLIAGTAGQIDTIAAAGATASVTLSLENNTALPGAPTAATAVKATNTTQIATTAHVKLQDVNSLAAPIANFSMNTNKITDLTDGTADQDAATVAQLNAAVSGALTHKGGYNASTNTPALDTGSPTLVLGDMYTVTVAGTFFTEALEIGDVLIADVDSVDAAALADWTIVQKNLDAASDTVAGYVELATVTETNTGTDGTRAVTPDGLNDWTGGSGAITKLGTVATGVWSGTAIAATAGGTGLTTYTTGDILYSSASNVLSKLAVGATDTFLQIAGGVPTWSTTMDGGNF